MNVHSKCSEIQQSVRQTYKNIYFRICATGADDPTTVTPDTFVPSDLQDSINSPVSQSNQADASQQGMEIESLLISSDSTSMVDRSVSADSAKMNNNIMEQRLRDIMSRNWKRWCKRLRRNRIAAQS